MRWAEQLLQSTRELLSTHVFTVGSVRITIWTLLYLIVLSVFLLFFSKWIKQWISRSLLKFTSLDIGRREAIGSITRYILLIIGFLVVIQTAGIDLTTLNVLAGAVGIGIGFGMQNIANNFISGIIILVERPVKIGDRVEVGTVEGSITYIGARSTSVVTNDNITILIPNSRLISDNVINWSHNDERVRFHIPFSVAYGTEVRLVEKLLLEIAASSPDVLENPPPSVRFKEFGESGLELELLAWTDTLTHRKGLLISKLNFDINDVFRKNNIEIPFPQRVVHLRGEGTSRN